MKNLAYLALALLFIYSCATTRNNDKMTQNVLKTDSTQTAANDTVRIANDSLEYEIIIIDPGFNTFLNSIARPENYYSQSYLENKNQFLVIDYNQRVQQPFRYNPDLYVQRIDYDPQIDYGYEVNYKLYNYFVFFAESTTSGFLCPQEFRVSFSLPGQDVVVLQREKI